jgi:hypothetical protein
MSLHRPRVQYGKRRSKINIVLFLYSGEYEWSILLEKWTSIGPMNSGWGIKQ